MAPLSKFWQDGGPGLRRLRQKGSSEAGRPGGASHRPLPALPKRHPHTGPCTLVPGRHAWSSPYSVANCPCHSPVRPAIGAILQEGKLRLSLLCAQSLTGLACLGHYNTKPRSGSQYPLAHPGHSASLFEELIPRPMRGSVAGPKGPLGSAGSRPCGKPSPWVTETHKPVPAHASHTRICLSRHHTGNVMPHHHPCAC